MDLRASFGPILGDWIGLERLEPTSADAGGPARAALSLKLDVGDQVVVQTYRRVREDGAELSAHGVFAAVSLDRVRWWWFDSVQQQRPGPAEGGWSEGELVLVESTPHGTTRHRWWRLAEDLGYRVSLDLGSGEQTVLTGRYARTSTH